MANADEAIPYAHRPRGRTCCAFAPTLPVHLGTAHMPVALSLVASPDSLGHHSYTGWDRLGEGTGLMYTARGGFIDLGHTRDYADLTAYLASHLRPMLADGAGSITLEPLESSRKIVVTKKVAPDILAETTARIAQRAAFEISVWSEIVQFYGRGKIQGAPEIYSSFTPEDVYSNLLGTYIGRRAIASDLPYDEAVDRELAKALNEEGPATANETRTLMNALAPVWWSKNAAWPSANIAVLRSFDIGPDVHPLLAPIANRPEMPGFRDVAPNALHVPDVDPDGAPLTDFYRVELVVDEDVRARFPKLAQNRVVTGADFPALVSSVRTALETTPHAIAESSADGHVPATPLTHYVNGLRLVELGFVGGVAEDTSERRLKGNFGGSFIGVLGDTRGGDFHFARFDLNETPERGLIARFGLLRSNVLYFCRDVESGHYRLPLVSLLGPCEPRTYFGFGGSIAEGFHDGQTGRTALRPISFYGVLNVLGNGQAASYDRVRVLLRGGGGVDHVWTEQEGGVTLPRVGGGALAFARTSGARFEARGTADYRLDPATPEDATFQTTLALRWNFLLGGHDAQNEIEAIDPWGVGSLGLVGAYSFWSRPLHSFDEETIAPFVSDQNRITWQLLLIASFGFEGLAF